MDHELLSQRPVSSAFVVRFLDEFGFAASGAVCVAADAVSSGANFAVSGEVSAVVVLYEHFVVADVDERLVASDALVEFERFAVLCVCSVAFGEYSAEPDAYSVADVGFAVDEYSVGGEYCGSFADFGGDSDGFDGFGGFGGSGDSGGFVAWVVGFGESFVFDEFVLIPPVKQNK